MAKPILLNVGSGGGRLDPPDHDEVTVDLTPGVADREGSLLALPVDDASVAVVYLGHVLEHVHRHEVPTALAECRRVLRPGGVLHVRVPDVAQVARKIVDDGLDAVAYVSPAGPIIPHDMLYGHTPDLAAGKAGMAHKTGFTGATLRAALEAAGFVQIAGERHPWELRAEGVKP